MKAKFKVNDQFWLRKAETFTRSFPIGGYSPDGSVREIDKTTKNAGSEATISEIHDNPAIDKGEVWYFLDFGDLKINLNEHKLLELFEPSEPL
jgi:hypothetical protein